MQKEIKQILDKGKSVNASASEKIEMCALFHQAENEFELKGQLLEELENTSVEESSKPFFKKLFAKLWEKIEKRKKENKPAIMRLSTFTKVAAAIIIGLVVGIYISSFRNSNNPVYYSAHSPKGSVSEVLLPDSTIIFLNADSKIKYSVEGKNGIREVFLEGEAWFDVQKNKRKRFIVHTPLYDVNVTGTQFNVKAYKSDNQITTTLEEGSIIVEATENCNLAENITMKPGEQMILDKQTNIVTIKEVNTNLYSSWKDNKLTFVNMKLDEVVILLERRYGVDIEVKNDTLLNLHFYATIKNETIIEILDIIKKTLPIQYDIVGQKIEITAE